MHPLSVLLFDPEQPRDDHGKFTSAGSVADANGFSQKQVLPSAVNPKLTKTVYTNPTTGEKITEHADGTLSHTAPNGHFTKFQSNEAADKLNAHVVGVKQQAAEQAAKVAEEQKAYAEKAAAQAKAVAEADGKLKQYNREAIRSKE